MPEQLSSIAPIADPSITAGNDLIDHELNQKVGAAIEYFTTEHGLDIDNGGNLQNEPTTEQLSRLEAWHQSTSQDGIIMPDMDIFTAKVVLARALMPQRDENGQVQYLFGKGTGAELALQGNVTGREKRLDLVPYRTHSDFEIYGVTTDNYDVIPHSGRFLAVFGGQEIYPVHNTKGLHDLPPDYLHTTAETVNYGGLDFLVPRLELQFVDKFEKQNEEVERKLRNNTDAEWLAKTYDLDADLLHSTIDDYVIAPKLATLKAPDEEATQIIPLLSRKVRNAKEMIVEENPNATDAEIAAAMSINMFLVSYASNVGIENVADLLDGTTGELKDDIAPSITASVRAKQQQIAASLQSKHQAVDIILQAAA